MVERHVLEKEGKVDQMRCGMHMGFILILPSNADRLTVRSDVYSTFMFLVSPA